MRRPHRRRDPCQGGSVSGGGGVVFGDGLRGHRRALRARGHGPPLPQCHGLTGITDQTTELVRGINSIACGVPPWSEHISTR
jgi:hypothetical protein